MGVLWNEIWQAWRASLRRPGFLLLAAGVLALGVGSTVLVGAMIEGTLMRPLPYPQADRLLAVGGFYDLGAQTSPEAYQHLQGMSGVDAIGLIRGYTIATNVVAAGRPEQVQAWQVDRHLLPTLGVKPALGRNFDAAEDRPHGPPAVLLSHAYWRRRFGGDRRVLGRPLMVEGSAHTIIGVLPPGFDLLGRGQLMLPAALPRVSHDAGQNYLAVVRRAAGARRARIGAQVETRIRAMYAGMAVSPRVRRFIAHTRYGAQSLAVSLHADQRPVLMLFLASGVLVLLIALVNLANLMFLRTLSREHDLAVRRALGGAWWRQTVPALAEALLVGALGAIAGVALAWAGLALMRRLVQPDIVDLAHVHLQAGVIGLGLLAGIAGAGLVTVVGFWRLRRLDDPGVLREGGRSGLGRRGQRLGRILVVAQVTLAMLLLMGAGLFMHALYQAAHAQLGFQPKRMLTFELAPVRRQYPDTASVQHLVQVLRQRLDKLPGVRSSVASTNLPVGQQFNIGSVHAPGRDPVNVQFRAVTPGFFPLFGIVLRQGRGFEPGDRHGAEPVAVINRELAEHEYGGHALGRTIYIEVDGRDVGYRIVGVAANTSQYGPLQPKPPILYLPLPQVPDRLINLFRNFEPMRFAVRVHGDPLAFRDAVRQAVAEVAPTQPIAQLRSLASILRGTMADARAELLLVGLFAAIALVLAAAGLYAVMAVAVAARERELGVRMALGASPGRLLRLVLRSGAWQVGVGLVVGVVIALSLSPALQRVLFDSIGRASAFEPAVVALAVLILLVAGLLACLLPALRAARTPPMRALRGA